MHKLLSTLLASTLLCAGLAAPLMSGCATTSSSSASSGPVELNGTKWKMSMGGNGRIDGRIVEFKGEATNGYVGTLIKKPRAWEDSGVTGVPDDFVMFRLKPTGTVNEYSGVYRTIGGDSGLAEQEVVVTIDGNQLRWNLETALWERVEE